jgi:hypothetical protein
MYYSTYSFMLIILISSIVGSMVIIGNTLIFNYIFLRKKANKINYFFDFTFGFIFVGFLALTINFFFPLNKQIGTIFLIISILFFVYFFLLCQNKFRLISIILLLSFTTFVLIAYSNVNRPDAGLYHLPYTKILNDNKLIVGLTNLHYRFGHTSIFQYISAIHVNSLFKEEFLNIPLALLPSIYLLNLYTELKIFEKKNNEKNYIFLFFLLIFSIYSFNRFSGLGNDGPANIFFFILIIYFLKLNKLQLVSEKEFGKIFLISSFLIMLKPYMILTILLPTFLFLINKNKKKLIVNKLSIFCISFVFLWLLKNILISGCFIFPVKLTCIKNFNFYNEKTVDIAAIEAESWAKGFPDKKFEIDYKSYISNFNWLETWSNNHLNKIIEKIFPLVILILIILSGNLYKLMSGNKLSNFNQLNKKYFFLFVLLSFFNLIWFLKFPVYRFGSSFIGGLIITFFCLLFVRENNNFINFKYLKYLVIFGIIGFYTKNLNRIIDNDSSYYNKPWPKIYSFDEKNLEKKFSKILNANNKFMYYHSNGEECMYSKSPCSNYLIENLKVKQSKNYTVFYIDND